MSLNPDFSEAFEAAVRCRAYGIGLVPVMVISRLTPEEWAKIRLMDSREAMRVLAVLDAPQLVDSRTKTPTFDAGVLARLSRSTE